MFAASIFLRRSYRGCGADTRTLLSSSPPYLRVLLRQLAMYLAGNRVAIMRTSLFSNSKTTTYPPSTGDASCTFNPISSGVPSNSHTTRTPCLYGTRIAIAVQATALQKRAISTLFANVPPQAALGLGGCASFPGGALAQEMSLFPALSKFCSSRWSRQLQGSCAPTQACGQAHQTRSHHSVHGTSVPTWHETEVWRAAAGCLETNPRHGRRKWQYLLSSAR